jgi:hypothetical protein
MAATAVVTHDRGFTGRRFVQPSKRSLEVENEILMRLSEGEALWAIYRSDREKFPHPNIWCEWLLADSELKLAHDVARQHAADVYVSDAMDVLDAEPERIMRYTEDGTAIPTRIDPASVVLAKHRSDVRMKRAAQINPAVYGDKTLHAGHDGKEIKTEVAMSITQTLAQLREAKRLGTEASSAIVEARRPEPSDKALLAKADERTASTPKPLEPGDPGMEFV